MASTSEDDREPDDALRALDREFELDELGTDSPPAFLDDDEEAEPSLMVPLVVVPALIIMVFVVIYTLFVLLSGEMKTPRENLARLLDGGANEREQAAFELVRQMLEYQTARGQGREPEWGIDASLLEDLRRAKDSLPPPETPADVWTPFVIAGLMAQLEDPEGVALLLDMTRLGERLDPGFQFGQNAIFVVGSIGEDLPEAQRLSAAGRMIELLGGEDEGVALLAAAALQNLESPGTIPALRGLLASRRLDARVQAAISLADLGDDAGRAVLLEATETAPYRAEHAEFPRRWSPQTVSDTRRKVLLALRELGALPSREALERLADSDEDPNLRSLVLELLRELPE